MLTKLLQRIQQNDVRYHNFYRDIIQYKYNWSTDFDQFVGVPGIYPGEKFVLENGVQIIQESNNKWHYSIYLSIIYVVVIFGIKYAMSHRAKGFELKRELVAWNLLLAIFSLIGCIRCLPEFVHILYTKGFTASYTQNTYVEDIRVNAWYLFFTLSKAPELVDTLFIVLRKRRLINLHWIHHTLTLTYSWFVFGDMPSTARWMVNMNFFVHTLMYTYYAMAALKIKIPRQVNVFITTLQIAQMFAGFYINIDCLHRKLTGKPADLGLSVALSGFSLYFLFFMLFVNFFVRTYILPGSSKVMKAAVKNGKHILADLNNNSNIDKDCKEVVKKLQ